MISGGYIWGRLRLAFTKIADRLNYSCLVMCMYCAIFLSKFFYVLFDTFHLNKKKTSHMFTQNKTPPQPHFSTTFFIHNKKYQRGINTHSINTFSKNFTI